MAGPRDGLCLSTLHFLWQLQGLIELQNFSYFKIDRLFFIFWRTSGSRSVKLPCLSLNHCWHRRWVCLWDNKAEWGRQAGVSVAIRKSDNLNGLIWGPQTPTQTATVYVSACNYCNPPATKTQQIFCCGLKLNELFQLDMKIEAEGMWLPNRGTEREPNMFRISDINFRS